MCTISTHHLFHPFCPPHLPRCQAPQHLSCSLSWLANWSTFRVPRVLSAHRACRWGQGTCRLHQGMSRIGREQFRRDCVKASGQRKARGRAGQRGSRERRGGFSGGEGAHSRPSVTSERGEHSGVNCFAHDRLLARLQAAEQCPSRVVAAPRSSRHGSPHALRRFPLPPRPPSEAPRGRLWRGASSRCCALPSRGRWVPRRRCLAERAPHEGSSELSGARSDPRALSPS